MRLSPPSLPPCLCPFLCPADHLNTDQTWASSWCRLWIDAGVQTAPISPRILLVMWEIFMTRRRVQFHQAFPLWSSPLFPPLLHKHQMSPASQKFYYLQVNISKPTGGGGLEMEKREREQINDKWVYIMPESAACNINGREGTQRLCVYLRVCLRARWSGVVWRTWLGDFYSCHTSLLRRNRPGPKTQRRLQQHQHSDSWKWSFCWCTSSVKCLLQTSSTRLHAARRNGALTAYFLEWSLKPISSLKNLKGKMSCLLCEWQLLLVVVRRHVSPKVSHSIENMKK